MAITIGSIPEDYPSLHDELFFVVVSDNVANVNFKYVFDVRIAGNLISRIKLFPDPSSGKGIFNASNIVRNYWESYFKPNATRTAFSYQGSTNYVEFVIQFGEEFDSTTTTNLASGTYKAYNFYPPVFRDFSSSFYSGYLSKFITNRDPDGITYHGTEKIYISFFQAATGNLALTVNNGSSTVGANVSCGTFTLLDVSPAAINTYLGSSFLTVGENYSVSCGGEMIRIKYVCTKYDPVSIHFLNELGGYDTFSFRLVNKETREMERRSFERKNWELDGSNMRAYDSYNRMHPGGVTFSVKQTAGYRLTSDYVNETDFSWLRELIGSAEVYLEQNGYYFPVMIKNNNWEEKVRIADKMFNLSLDVEVMKVNSQYR
jgi:hypothetical protein